MTLRKTPLRTTIVPTATLNWEKGGCRKGLLSLSMGTVPKKAKPLNKLRPAVAGLRLPLGTLLF